MATSRTDPSYRTQKNEKNAQAIATSCTDPSYRSRKMKEMIKLWQQVVLIQHTEDRSKSLIKIEEDWQESNRFFMTWQLILILQVAHTFTISLAGYGMKNIVMGVGTFICQVHQVPQKRNVVQMMLCLLLVASLMKD
jgi:hypothetical protein